MTQAHCCPGEKAPWVLLSISVSASFQTVGKFAVFMHNSLFTLVRIT